MKYGLSEITVEKIRGVFEAFPEIEKAILYGSRAKGNFKPASDIDLTLYGDTLTPDLRLTIASELDDLLLPYTIDLSIFDELNHAKLREHIERVGVVFYEREKQGAGMKEGWQTKTLDQIAENLDSKRVPITKADRVRGEYPYYGASGIVDYVDDYIFDCDALLVSEDGANLLARSTPIAFPASGKYWVNNHAHILEFENMATQRFVELYLESIPLDEYITGAAQPKLNQKALNSIPIPFPPLPEQQRIIGILNEAFDGIATTKANAEKNLKNACTIFKSHLQSVFTQRGDGWVDRTLDQVCIVERGSSPRPIKNYFTTDTNGVNWIKIGDTKEGGKYVSSTAQKITLEGAKQSRFVKEGDFILTNSMSFGRPYIMKTSGYIHDGWFVLRLNISIDTDYFYYLLSSRFVQSQFAQLASGSVVKNISGDLVKKTVLPIPPLAHQHVIVKKLLELSAESQRLESLYRRKLAALDALKKSLLNQAFTGQL